MVNDNVFVSRSVTAQNAAMALRIRILTIGSHGDVRPYLALARGLAAHAHDVRVLGPDHFRASVAPAGVAFEGLGPHYPMSEIRHTLEVMASTSTLAVDRAELYTEDSALRQLAESFEIAYAAG
ncbi:MAG: glycosyltransferase [Polyangiales bacterium]